MTPARGEVVDVYGGLAQRDQHPAAEPAPSPIDLANVRLPLKWQISFFGVAAATLIGLGVSVNQSTVLRATVEAQGIAIVKLEQTMQQGFAEQREQIARLDERAKNMERHFVGAMRQ